MTPCWEKSSSGLRLRTEHSLTKEGEDSAALIHEDKTKIIHECMFDVQNEVGLGRKEEAYHRACEIWLICCGIPFSK